MDAHSIRLGPNVARIVLGGVWIAGALVNALWTFPNAATVWDDLGVNATFAPYRWLFRDVVGASPEVWTFLLVIGELALGAILLTRGAWARAGLVAGTLWCLFLSFLIWPYTAMMPFVALLSGWLLRYDHSASVLTVVHRLHLDPHLTGRRA